MPDSHPTTHPTIVLVEDDMSLLSALKFALEADGFEVLGYGEGRSAVRAAPQAAARCLVVDLNLPDVDGLGLIDSLRRLGVRAPAILITTNPDDRCRRAAAVNHVTIVEKPLVGGELRRCIDAAVAAHAQASNDA